MLKDFLKDVQEASQFTVQAYDGQLELRGNILSPAQVESASLTNTLVLQGIAEQKDLSKIQRMHEQLSNEPTEEVVQEAYDILSKIRPEQLAKISQSQDKIICSCIHWARKAGDENWERLFLVLTVEEQDAERNRLWVGMLPKADRDAILQQALKGQEEAVKQLQTFRRQ